MISGPLSKKVSNVTYLNSLNLKEDEMRSLDDDGPDECKEDPVTLMAGTWEIFGEETSGSPFKVDDSEVLVIQLWSR